RSAAIDEPHQREQPDDHAEALVDVVEPQLERFLLGPEIGDPETHHDNHGHQRRRDPMEGARGGGVAGGIHGAGSPISGADGRALGRSRVYRPAEDQPALSDAGRFEPAWSASARQIRTAFPRIARLYCRLRIDASGRGGERGGALQIYCEGSITTSGPQSSSVTKSASSCAGSAVGFSAKRCTTPAG